MAPVAGDSAVTPSEVEWPEDEDAPAVFFNACLLGRVRHIAGGRQKGWAVTVLARGSPAVVGALASVPDTACPLVAREIYRAAWLAPVGEALRLARERLDADGYHPLIAGPTSCTETRTRCSRGPRTRRCRSRRGADDALAGAAHALPRHARARLSRRAARRCARRRPVVGPRRGPAELLDDLDAEGAGALRIVLCADRLERGVPDPGDELQAGYLAAAALEDSYAMAYLLMRHRPLWQSLYPDESEALATTLEARLRMLDADRVLIG